MNIATVTNSTAYSASLRVTCRLVDGVTQVVERYHQVPLKISKTFREELSSRLWMYMVDVSPGMLDGDGYELAFQLEAGTHLVLTNQSFTKVHPTPYHMATLDAHYQIGRDATLEYFPEPTIPYAGSRFRSTQRFDLEHGASLIYADITTPGRTHRDEKFAFTEFASAVEVYREGRLLVWDHFRLEPQRDRHTLIGAFEHYSHSGSLWLVTQRPFKAVMADVRQLAYSKQNENLLVGVSELQEQGFCVRVLGHNVWQIQQLFQQVWELCRVQVFDLPAITLRK